MIRTDGTPELTPRQKDLFISNVIRIAHSRMTPAQKDAAINTICEAFMQAPAVDDVTSVTIELSSTRLAQLSGMSAGTAQEAAAFLHDYGMKRTHRKEQITGGRFVSQTFVDVSLDPPQYPQSRPAPTPRAERKRDATDAARQLADAALKLLNTPCPVCGVVGEWHLHCHSCGATWSAGAASVAAPPDIDSYGTGMYTVHAGETAAFSMVNHSVGAEAPPEPAQNGDYGTGMYSVHAGEDVTEGQKTPDKDFCTIGNSLPGEGAESGTTSYDTVDTVLAPASEPDPLPAAAPYVPGSDQHPNPLINEIGTDKRFLPCKVIPQPGDKPKKIPLRQGPDGKPCADGWQDPEGWMTFYAAQVIAPQWGADAYSVQLGGPEHDVTDIDLDKCLADGRITSERIEQIVKFLDTYTTISVSGTGLHPWLIDKTHLIPQKLNEKAEPKDIGVYRHCNRHICERFESFGPVLPVRVITDPAQARTICRMLGVMPTDEMVIAPPVPSHAPAKGTTDRQTWALGLLARLSTDRCEYYDSWIRVGMALSEFGDAGLSMWDTWSRGSKKYKPGECESKWNTFSANGGVTLGTLYQYAREDDPGGQR